MEVDRAAHTDPKATLVLCDDSLSMTDLHQASWSGGPLLAQPKHGGGASCSSLAAAHSGQSRHHPNDADKERLMLERDLLQQNLRAADEHYRQLCLDTLSKPPHILELQLRALLWKPIYALPRHITALLTALLGMEGKPVCKTSLEIELPDMRGQRRLSSSAGGSRDDGAMVYCADIGEDLVILGRSLSELQDAVRKAAEMMKSGGRGEKGLEDAGVGKGAAGAQAHVPRVIQVTSPANGEGGMLVLRGAGSGSGSGVELSSSMTADPEEIKKRDALIALLLKQLDEVKSGKDGAALDEEPVSLSEAKERLREAAMRLMGGDENAQADFDKWDKYIQTHPQHIAEKKLEEERWLEDNEKPNREALELMRTFVPPDLWRTNLSSLQSREGVTDALAKRIWNTKALWLLRADKDFVSRVHESDLMIRYSINGLDIVELRALFACLPDKFDNDPSGKKEEWRQGVLTKLKDMCHKQATGQLTGTHRRHGCYRAAKGTFDPTHAESGVQAAKSSAFDNLARAEVEILRRRRHGSCPPSPERSHDRGGVNGSSPSSSVSSSTGSTAPSTRSTVSLSDAHTTPTPATPRRPLHASAPPSSLAPQQQQSQDGSSTSAAAAATVGTPIHTSRYSQPAPISPSPSPSAAHVHNPVSTGTTRHTHTPPGSCTRGFGAAGRQSGCAGGVGRGTVTAAGASQVNKQQTHGAALNRDVLAAVTARRLKMQQQEDGGLRGADAVESRVGGSEKPAPRGSLLEQIQARRRESERTM